MLGRNVPTAFAAITRRAVAFLNDQRLYSTLVNCTERLIQAQHTRPAFGGVGHHLVEHFDLLALLGLLADLQRAPLHLILVCSHAHGEGANHQALPAFRQKAAQQRHIFIRAANQHPANVVVSKEMRRQFGRLPRIALNHLILVVRSLLWVAAAPAWHG